MSIDRIFAFAIMGSMIAFSIIHLGVSVGIIVPYRQYGDVYRPQIGLASFNLVICIISFFGGIAGLVSIGIDAKWLGRVVSGISAVLAIFCIASLITALVINAKSFSFAYSRFSYHMINYQKQADSQRIIDLIQNNGQCCGSNLWIDWGRVSLNADAPPLFTTTTSTTSTSTGSTTNATVSTPPLTPIVDTNSTTASSNTESSTTTSTATVAPSSVTTSESTSTTSTTATSETSLSVTTLTTTATTTTIANNLSDSSITTVSPVTSESSSSSSSTTSTASPVTGETSASSSSTTSTASPVTGETSASSSSATSTASSVTSESSSSSTTTSAILDENNTSSTTSTSTGQANTENNGPATAITTSSQDNSVGTTVVSKKRRSVDAQVAMSPGSFSRRLESSRSKRQVASVYDAVSNFTKTFTIVLPSSCCESNAIFTNNGSGSYCISNANGTINKYHVRGCAQEIDRIAGSQAMGFGVINSCMIVIAFSSIPILWKIPSA